MCAQYELPLKFFDAFGVAEPDPNLGRSVYPTNFGAMIRHVERRRHLDAARFGLLPHWAETVSYGRKTYNARSETVAKLPSYKGPWKKRQLCLVPVQHFYEPNYESGKPVRWAIERVDQRPFALAGIWEWRGIGELVEHSFSMLTINATGHPLMARFHGPEDERRSVVVVEPDDYDDFLSAQDESELRGYLQLMDPALYQGRPSPAPPRAKKAAEPST
jgi:putative SOS response-associated peptidase YedK